MKIFQGLTADQKRVLRSSSAMRRFQANQDIFSKGDPAERLYVIMDGEVEIFRKNKDGSEVVLATLGKDEVFGEMGLLRENGFRTASARTSKESIILETVSEPLEFLRNMGDPIAGIIFVQNLIMVLAKRLNQRDKGDKPVAGPLYDHVTIEGFNITVHKPDPRGPLAKIENALPKGMFKRFMSRKKLSDGDCLCIQGENPDGFYFIHSGTLEVLKREEGSAEGSRLLGELTAPGIAGEIGFFSNEKRSATLRAKGPVEVTLFSSKDFANLKKEEPEVAFQVLFAAARLAVFLLLRREHALDEGED